MFNIYKYTILIMTWDINFICGYGNIILHYLIICKLSEYMNVTIFKIVYIFNISIPIGYFVLFWQGPSWPWSYGFTTIYAIPKQCLSPLVLRVRISIRARRTTLCNKVCQSLAVGGFLRVLRFPPPVKLTTTI